MYFIFDSIYNICNSTWWMKKLKLMLFNRGILYQCILCKQLTIIKGDHGWYWYCRWSISMPGTHKDSNIFMCLFLKFKHFHLYLLTLCFLWLNWLNKLPVAMWFPLRFLEHLPTKYCKCRWCFLSQHKIATSSHKILSDIEIHNTQHK